MSWNTGGCSLQRAIHIGVNDNFFHVGGDSARVILVQTELSGLLGRSVSSAKLFEQYTIKTLAAHLAGEDEAGGQEAVGPTRVSPMNGMRTLPLSPWRVDYPMSSRLTSCGNYSTVGEMSSEICPRTHGTLTISMLLTQTHRASRTAAKGVSINLSTPSTPPSLESHRGRLKSYTPCST